MDKCTKETGFIKEENCWSVLETGGQPKGTKDTSKSPTHKYKVRSKHSSNNPNKGFTCLSTATAIMPKINITINEIKE